MTSAQPKPPTPPSEFGPGLAQASVLVVDDEAGIRHFITRILEPVVGRVEQASNAAEASRMLDASHFDIVILDNLMPGTKGLDWLGEQRELGLFADVILITAFADMDTAIEAMRAGAVDFVLKPFRSNQILNAVARCADRGSLRRENYLLKYELATGGAEARGRLLGTSPMIEDIRSTLERAAPLPTPVLFTGETGTGKEIAARALHAMSERADKPFVPVNCAALPDDVAENELFGLVAAGQSRSDGLFLNANGGTLYLDEVAELPQSIQAAILRVIENRRIRPVGAVREVPLDLRFIFATNTDLEKAVEEGRFRADLYHRINVLNIRMPALRERQNDLKELAMMFIGQISRSLGVEPLVLDEGVLRNLARYDWPGNVRELRNLIERSLILGEFPPEFASSEPGEAVEAVDSLQAVERRHILAVLDTCNGNRAEAARRLGISRKTIDRKCAMWNV
ncbi:two component Fis family sigma54 specific transcriptional regulator [Aliiruegeria haliotis]|uniref:Nif-specific regulatory protein n=1 Tax=Aliiruegeria haliotis TaxID=1280846 RepID=A0A2T0RPQ8_9RHOB|nr:sigma-54 dependent transcriptional regulator [Aliiruegeria haliotis]PRY23073.1 two component Fis family sigma54 specific transcriptional regulator [Aliiruegeria haliotis]